MNKASLTLSLALCVLTMSSCAVTPAKPQVHQLGSISTVSDTADTQVALIKQHGGAERYCAAPQSDVADTRSEGGSLSFTTALTGSDSIGDGSSEGALSLGGRNPAVLIVREMMYRACELSLNLNADHDQTLEIYNLFIDSAKDIAVSQSGVGANALGEAAESAAQTLPATNSDSSSSSSDSSDSSDSEPEVVQGVC